MLAVIDWNNLLSSMQWQHWAVIALVVWMFLTKRITLAQLWEQIKSILTPTPPVPPGPNPPVVPVIDPSNPLLSLLQMLLGLLSVAKASGNKELEDATMKVIAHVSGANPVSGVTIK